VVEEVPLDLDRERTPSRDNCRSQASRNLLIFGKA
jgi:hypothetical protein